MAQEKKMTKKQALDLMNRYLEAEKAVAEAEAEKQAVAKELYEGLGPRRIEHAGRSFRPIRRQNHGKDAEGKVTDEVTSTTYSLRHESEEAMKL